MKIFCKNCGKVNDPEIPAGANEIPCPSCSATVQVPETPLSPGAVIGDFLLEKPLSSGGMGVVYLARQISLDRPVALKVLHDKFANNAEYIDGLFREARAAAKLTHPNIVQAYAVGEENGIFYFAMEYIQGETFKQILKKQNILDFDQAVKVIREVCGALQAAWTEQKLVHQDIKPDNIMLSSNGFAKLADLGLARSANSDSGPAEDENEVMGTPQYISPEQLTGVPTDVRSDIYSLGATFYQFVTGQFPYPEESAEAMAHRHVEGNLTPPVEINPELPQQLSDVIVKMMARNIEERFQMPSDVIAALDAYTDQKKISAMAVPKLKLNLNKKPGAPGVPAKPGLPPKGGAPVPTGLKAPSAPAPVKPATPAPAPVKPAAPAPAPVKPAAPAAAPVKPAAPAPATPKPAAQEKPATESSKQETPAQKSSGDEIALTPQAPKAKPAEDGNAADSKESGKEKKGGKGKENDKGKTKKEQKRNANSGKTLLFILLPLFLLIIAAALFFVAFKGMLGAQAQKFAVSTASSLGIKLPENKSENKQAAPVAQAPSVPQPAPIPVPVTRKDFLSEIERLQAFFRANPAQNAKKFLEDAEQFQLHYLPAVTKEEKEAYGALRRIYASADETTRALAHRNSIIEKIQKELDSKAQEIQNAQRKAEIQAKELAAQKAAAAALQKEAQKERDARIKKLQTDLNAMYKKLAESFFAAVRANDMEILQKVSNEFADYSVPNATNAEYGMLDEFKKFRERFLPAAFKQFAQFHERLKIVTKTNSIPAGVRMDIEIIRIAPPPQGVFKAVYVKNADSGKEDKKEEKIRLTRRIRSDIYDYLNGKFKTKTTQFFYEFMEGRFRQKITSEMYPAKEWNTYLKHFAPVIKLP